MKIGQFPPVLARPTFSANLYTGASCLSKAVFAWKARLWRAFSGLMRILVVEDDEKVAALVERALKEEQFAVDVARDGECGLFQAQSVDYDLVVLDVVLPNK